MQRCINVAHGGCPRLRDIPLTLQLGELGLRLLLALAEQRLGPAQGFAQSILLLPRQLELTSCLVPLG